MAERKDGQDDELARRRIWKEFRQIVNMPPAELSDWLETEDSKSAGWTRHGEGESVGHHSGRRIVEIRRKKKAALEDEDYRHMEKVVGYARRHLAQGGPARDRDRSKWRYSLMNWGHDPLRGH